MGSRFSVETFSLSDADADPSILDPPANVLMAHPIYLQMHRMFDLERYTDMLHMLKVKETQSMHAIRILKAGVYRSMYPSLPEEKEEVGLGPSKVGRSLKRKRSD